MIEVYRILQIRKYTQATSNPIAIPVTSPDRCVDKEASLRKESV